MSLARAHFQRTVAAREAAAPKARPAKAVAVAGAADGITSHGTLAEKMAALMLMHQATLKTLQSRTSKIDAKRGMLPEYAAYVDGVLAADGGSQDDVLVRVMLWRLDVADWAGAMEIAAHAIRHGLTMPEGFSRDVPTTLLEEIADFALAQSPPVADLAEPLSMAMEMTGEADMPDEVRAKAHKALGRILADTNPGRAVEHFEAAFSLDSKSGVKTDLTRARKALESQSGT